MPTSSSSSVQAARQVLADRLREMRRDAGLEGKQLAAACGWHPSKVSRIATAKSMEADDGRHDGGPMPPEAPRDPQPSGGDSDNT
ncbi:helix-turn-helix domain-containing protein [Streptomyces angustmyceticus]|uniref:helix-turn-helix domain-containing protein n=1 Tax=Streptomyces angustmyceticus TaxID=285578 RepID=UPI003D8EC8C6